MDHLINEGLACLSQQNYQGAAEQFRQATILAPDHPIGHLNLGAVLWHQNDLGGATSAIQRALTLDPRLVQAHVNLAVMYAEREQFTEALQHLELSVQITPDAAAYHNIGIIQRRQGNRQQALEAFNKALDLQPHDWLTQLNCATELLVLGQFTAGWQAYEARLGNRAVYDSYTIQKGKPQWNGQWVDHLVIHYEQGFGDTIQSCRYIDAASQRCNRLTLIPQPVLLKLLQSSFADNPKITVTDIHPVEFDCYQWIDGLPRWFDAGSKPIPAKPYLRVPSSTTWQRRFAALAGRKIGLVWAGRADIINDNRRSMHLDNLDQLLDVSDVSFISLQRDCAEHDPRLFDAARYFTDWSITAAAIQELDLVISVDTAVAHLAGALGKPVWLLNRFDTCWRWQLERMDSPWYPTMRIFRQPVADDWQTVLTEVIKAIHSQ